MLHAAVLWPGQWSLSNSTRTALHSTGWLLPKGVESVLAASQIAGGLPAKHRGDYPVLNLLANPSADDKVCRSARLKVLNFSPNLIDFSSKSRCRLKERREAPGALQIVISFHRNADMITVIAMRGSS